MHALIGTRYFSSSKPFDAIFGGTRKTREITPPCSHKCLVMMGGSSVLLESLFVKKLRIQSIVFEMLLSNSFNTVSPHFTSIFDNRGLSQISFLFQTFIRCPQGESCVNLVYLCIFQCSQGWDNFLPSCSLCTCPKGGGGCALGGKGGGFPCAKQGVANHSPGEMTILEVLQSPFPVSCQQHLSFGTIDEQQEKVKMKHLDLDLESALRPTFEFLLDWQELCCVGLDKNIMYIYDEQRLVCIEKSALGCWFVDSQTHIQPLCWSGTYFPCSYLNSSSKFLFYRQIERNPGSNLHVCLCHAEAKTFYF